MATQKEDKWSKLLNQLPSRVAEVAASKATAPDPVDEGHYNYQQSVSAIPAKLYDRLSDPEEELRVEAATQPSWCLCEVPEGDYPRIRVFTELELLVRHIAKLEGEEVSVWAFYGTPLRLTQQDKQGCRYLQVSHQDMVKLPARGEDVKVIPNDTELVFQEDGWLGDTSFTEGAADNYYAYQPPKDDAFDPDDDDDMHEVDA